MSFWMILLVMAIVTYATRALPLLISWQEPHPLLERALRYTPPAIFSALIVPSVLMPGGSGVEANLTLYAALIGAVIAWCTRNMALTIVGGVGSFTLLSLLLLS
jgi:branched-subunit amino acid transport protein